MHQAIPFLNRKFKPCIKNTAVKSQNAGCPALSKCLSLRHLELHAYCPPVTCSSEPEVQLCPTHPTAAPTVHAPIRQHHNPPCRPPSWSPITHAAWKKSSAQQLSLGGQTSSTSQPLRAKRAWLPGSLHLHLHTSERQSRGGHATLQRSSLCEDRIRLMTGNRHAARGPLTRAPHASGGSLAFSTIG